MLPDTRNPRTRYPPIENHGVIGDLHSAALVSTDGTIDWYCSPHFDSPSVFAAMLDADRGGFWRIAPFEHAGRSRQLYFPDTNVLITRFLHPEGVTEVQDFMPISSRAADRGRHRLVRRVLGVRGALPMRMECLPAFDYGRNAHELSLDGGAIFRTQTLTLGLHSPVPLGRFGDGAWADFSLAAGESATFLLEVLPSGAMHVPPLHEDEASEAFEHTVSFWRRWLSRSHYTGRWRETVHRSALALKLFTFQPTGAIVASPTASLPEAIGGARNWDYRYTWVRDTAFTLYALLRLGFTEEAEAFMGFLEARARETEHAPGPSGPLQIMYGIDGRTHLPEEELGHLAGYMDSRPVRIGNGAADQLQLDIYGELMDAVYLYDRHASPISWGLWNALRRIVDWLSDNWRQPDEGIWEVRGGRQQFVYSKLMTWVAYDRALRIARQRGLPGDERGWRLQRDAVYEDVMRNGWSPERGAFVQHYGATSLDAANLLMPLVKFIGPTDPRMLATLDATTRELVSDSLVYRYDPALAADDGLGSVEGTFSMCSFWYVECLTRAGRLDEARLVFEKMLTYANHLGLYGEEIGPSGEALGNFPQAFTHLALISAAVNLDRKLGQGYVV